MDRADLLKAYGPYDISMHFIQISPESFQCIYCKTAIDIKQVFNHVRIHVEPVPVLIASVGSK